MENVEKLLFISMIFSAVFNFDYTTHFVGKKAKRVESKILLISPCVHAMLDTNRKGVKGMLGARIALLRRQQSMSQAELAAALRISPSAVGMYEQGRREPSAQMLVAMAEFFGVTTDYLLTGKCFTPQEQQAARKLLQDSLVGLEARIARRDKPFSRQELTTLLAALLQDA